MGGIKDFKKIITVKRRKKSEMGIIYYQYLDFEVDDNPTTVHYSKRIISKLIDWSLYNIFFMIVFLMTKNQVNYHPIILLFISLCILLLLNSLMENRYGTTFGKYLNGLIVIDNHGRLLTIPIALKRNFLSVFSIIIQSKSRLITKGLKRNRHNELCTTYVVDQEKIHFILSRLIHN